MDTNKIALDLHPGAVDPRVTVANYISVAHAGYPRHDVANPELVLVVEGRLQAEDPDHARTLLGPGDVVYLRPHKPCDLLKQSRELVISCIHFDLHPVRRYAQGGYRMMPEEPWVVRTGRDWVLVDLFRRCAAEFAGYHPRREALLSCMMKEIWLRLMGTLDEAAHPGGRMGEMMRFLRARLDHPVGRADLARAFDLTPEHVNHLFKTQLGLTPTRFLNRERVLAAARMLQAGVRPIHEVAGRVGFDDPLYFSRVFKSVLGFPPSRLR